MKNLHSVYLCLGTNLGDRKLNLFHAREALSEAGLDVIRVSAVYASEPWGYSSENGFYNQCMKVRTFLEPVAFLEKLLTVEEEMGRRRAVVERGYSDRKIDLDILFFDKIILSQNELVLPHPRMHLRKFVLVPLAEIAPDLVHPLLGKTISELLEACEDEGVVTAL